MKTIRQHPILILLVINLIIGLMTFRSYGLAWDEPLFYDYGEALIYAYTPANWFSGNFDLENSYGASGSDHANRGPAYLLLVTPLISILKRLGSDPASAWHLVNFLTFLLGIYLFYRLASKWMSGGSALAAAALFSFQPLLWGHAFINPKDLPFLTFFLGAVLFGFEMIDEWNENLQFTSSKLLLASFFLGIATSIRILAPLAGLIVLLYAASSLKRNIIKRSIVFRCISYALFAFLFMLLTWPYLWSNPVARLMEVLLLMGEHPASIQVLFSGQLYRAYELPWVYLPKLLILTLTEPVLPLAAAGILTVIWKRQNWNALAPILLWFVIPFLYVILRRPPLSDNYRHFLFILPPLFIFAGVGLEFIASRFLQKRAVAVISSLLLLPGIYSGSLLHPYEYAYYNSLAAEVNGNYETDYWLTCYREAVLEFNESAPEGSQLFVRREAYIAAYYADPRIAVRDYRNEKNTIQTGDYYLVNTRANEHLVFLRDEPAVVEVSRMGAALCVIKQVP